MCFCGRDTQFFGRWIDRYGPFAKGRFHLLTGQESKFQMWGFIQGAPPVMFVGEQNPHQNSLDISTISPTKMGVMFTNFANWGRHLLWIYMDWCICSWGIYVRLSHQKDDRRESVFPRPDLTTREYNPSSQLGPLIGITSISNTRPIFLISNSVIWY